MMGVRSWYESLAYAKNAAASTHSRMARAVNATTSLRGLRRAATVAPLSAASVVGVGSFVSMTSMVAKECHARFRICNACLAFPLRDKYT